MSNEPNGRWSRRDFLEALSKATASAAILNLSGCVSTSGSGIAPFPDSPTEDSDRMFPQGLASGDPRPDGFLLWTRAPGLTEGGQVKVQIAEDEAFERIVSEGAAQVSSESDYTLRIRTAGLKSNHRYWYRFRADDVSSVIGRTRTAPDPEADVPVSVAVTSCQDYQGRWYHAWRALAERADEIDFVLFLGDYIYEYERYPGLQEPQPGRQIKMPDGLVIDEANGVIAAQSLNDYREIYRVTRADADLKRIHQLCPFVIIWDDHEHANDAWADHACDFNDLQGDEKDTARREAATRAWYEHLPVDVEYNPALGFPDDIVTWRKLRWGKHVELFLTDQRYYRDDHVVPEGTLDAAVGKLIRNSPLGSRTFCIKSAFEEREAKVNPTMLGAHQKDWFIRSVKESDATWKVWGSALMVSQFVLDLSTYDKIPAAFKNKFYFKTDQWDGFLTERKKILGELKGTENFVVLSGDLHGFYASHIHDDFDSPDRPMGVEFTVAGISSISLLEQIDAIVKSQPMLAATGLGQIVPEMDSNLMTSCPYFVHADSRGYGAEIARFDSEKLDVEFIALTGIREPEWNRELQSLHFSVAAGSSTIERAG